MVLKLWKPVRVCICEMLPVEFGWSCRVANVVGNVSDTVRFIVGTLRSVCVRLTSRGRLGPRGHLSAACEDEKDMQARTPSKKAAIHFDGDFDNSDEGDWKVSNKGGTDDADDCDVAAESRRFRTIKGDKCFLLPKMQALAKPFKIFLSFQKEFRKDCDRAFKASDWETTNTKKTHAASHQCGYPRAKAILSRQVRL